MKYQGNRIVKRQNDCCIKTCFFIFTKYLIQLLILASPQTEMAIDQSFQGSALALLRGPVGPLTFDRYYISHTEPIPIILLYSFRKDKSLKNSIKVRHCLKVHKMAKRSYNLKILNWLT